MFTKNSDETLEKRKKALEKDLDILVKKYGVSPIFFLGQITEKERAGAIGIINGPADRIVYMLARMVKSDDKLLSVIESAIAARNLIKS